MKKSDFYYPLPKEHIAQYPLEKRSESRLLCLEGATGAIKDRRFSKLPALLTVDDLLVFNDTRVIPARLCGVKATGGRVEVLVERVLDDHRVWAMVRANKPLKPGSRLKLEGTLDVNVVARESDFYELEFGGSPSVLEILEAYGHMPLPPYIERADDRADRQQYQTVYADRPGAVAAPTAGLHFDQPLFDALETIGVEQVFLTLHVGAGTFQPVRVEDIEQHHMHAEFVQVSDSVCEAVSRCRARGGRVIAVGTTTVRSLEAAAEDGECRPFQGETDIFITPGYMFRVVDAMITNFHLPESTLLMLVAAFGGYANVMDAYRHAVAHRYRFYSYGDAMFITKRRSGSEDLDL